MNEVEPLRVYGLCHYGAMHRTTVMLPNDLKTRAQTKLADQGPSFTDCVSFVLMKRRRLRRVFTFDRHFAAAGFEMWPGRVLD